MTTAGSTCRPTSTTPAPTIAGDTGTTLAERRADQTERATRSITRAPRVTTLTAQARGVPAVRKKRPQLRVTSPRRVVERARTAVRKVVKHRKVRALRRAPARTVRVTLGARVGAQRVLAYAYDQIGKPYVLGAAGPSAFDCSGLTLRAFKRAGIRLPHKASGQSGRRVSRAQARPGDLVKWGGYHVGIYVGGGYVIHSPKPGDRVKKSRLWGTYRFVRLL